MQHVRRALPTVLIAAALAAGTAACGTAKPAASPDPLAKLTADQIVNRATANLNQATSVRFAGTVRESGQTITLALTLVRGKGCQGSMGLQGKGTFQIVYNEKTVWMLPSDSFYKSEAGASSAVISLLSGKWLKLGKTSELGDLSSFCSLSSMVSQMNQQPAKVTKGTDTTVDGQRAVTLHQAVSSQFGTAYVSDTAKPELLKITAPKGSTTGSITFSGYDAPVTIALPPAGKTLNGSQFGF
jgi:hypothetical protein